MIFRLGELFCGPGGLDCGAKTAGSVVGNANRQLPESHSAGECDRILCTA